MNCLQIPFLKEMAYVVFRFFIIEQKSDKKN